MTASTASAPESYVERTRPYRVDALMWIAQHAGVLADGYNISASDTYDRRPGAAAHSIGVVSVQGESGALSSLVARFNAVHSVERENGYVEWITYDDGVMLRFVEEPAR